MKKINLLLFIVFSILLGQDRSLLFNAGPPNTQDGFILTNNGNEGTAIADKFFVADDYVLEAFYVYLKLVDSDSGSVNIKLHNDLNDSPGTIIYSWDVTIDPRDDVLDDYFISTVGECHSMSGGNNYWLSISVNEPDVQVLWGYSPFDSYYSSISEDLGITWAPSTQGFVGATKIYAEQIFYAGDIAESNDLGDVNSDGVLNVLDIVQNVNFILGNLDFDENQIIQADFNEDGRVNVLDIVQAVNYILSQSNQIMPKFLVEDINPSSEYFGQMIGPDTFSGDISCYYFGKGG